MKRRRLMELGFGLTAVAGAGIYGWLSFNSPQVGHFKSLDEVVEFIESVPLDAEITSSGTWTANQVFTHLSQSILYSMHGYPEHKSDLFQSTLGKLAFQLFTVKGASTHNLAEPIPGAKPLSQEGNPHQALRLLSGTIKELKGRDSFQPHFAYGDLSKSQYEIAHLMHINEHFSEIDVVLPPGNKK